MSESITNLSQIKDFFEKETFLSKHIGKSCQFTRGDRKITFCKNAFSWLSREIVDMESGDELTPKQLKILDEDPNAIFTRTKNKLAFNIALTVYVILLFLADWVDPLTAMDFVYNDLMDVAITLLAIYLFGWWASIGFLECFNFIPYEGFFYIDVFPFIPFVPLGLHTIIFAIFLINVLVLARTSNKIQISPDLIKETSKQREEELSLGYLGKQENVTAQTGLSASQPSAVTIGSQQTTRLWQLFRS